MQIFNLLQLLIKLAYLFERSRYFHSTFMHCSNENHMFLDMKHLWRLPFQQHRQPHGFTQGVSNVFWATCVLQKYFESGLNSESVLKRGFCEGKSTPSTIWHSISTPQTIMLSIITPARATMYNATINYFNCPTCRQNNIPPRVINFTLSPYERRGGTI